MTRFGSQVTICKVEPTLETGSAISVLDDSDDGNNVHHSTAGPANDATEFNAMNGVGNAANPDDGSAFAAEDSVGMGRNGRYDQDQFGSNSSAGATDIGATKVAARLSHDRKESGHHLPQSTSTKRPKDSKRFSYMCTMKGGVRIEATTTLKSEATKDWDVVAIPGGLEGCNRMKKSGLLSVFLMNHKNKQRWIGACGHAPAVLLSKMLPPHHTCFPHQKFVKMMRQPKPEHNVVVKDRFVTGQGASTAMIFALQLAEVSHRDPDRANFVAKLFLLDRERQPQFHYSSDIPCTRGFSDATSRSRLFQVAGQVEQTPPLLEEKATTSKSKAKSTPRSRSKASPKSTTTTTTTTTTPNGSKQTKPPSSVHTPNGHQCNSPTQKTTKIY